MEAAFSFVDDHLLGSYLLAAVIAREPAKNQKLSASNDGEFSTISCCSKY